MDNTHLAHFGLVEEPYSTSPNPRYLYISPTHNLALEKTKWTITSKHITNPNFPTPNQLLRAINQEFECGKARKATSTCSASSKTS
jgi:type II secretory pathway predicted ATPase ExeA